MKFSSVEESLFGAIEEIKVVDAHEHLPPEKMHIRMNRDLLTLFDQYVRIDLLASGMTPDYRKKIHDPAIPVKKRWKLLAPYLENIKYGPFVRAVFLAIKELYGVDEINEANCEALSEHISAARTPGIYRRILRDKCNIRVALTNSRNTGFDLDLLKPVWNIWKYAGTDKTPSRVISKEMIEANAAELGEEVKSLDDYLELTRKGLEAWKSAGVVGVKNVSHVYMTPKKSQAVSLFNKVQKGQNLDVTEMNMLSGYLRDEIYEMVADLEMVVPVHSGFFGDFRKNSPQIMIPVIKKHPNTRFDIFHAGIPFIRELALMAKNFPNVWLNMCWAHLVSPKMMQLLMDELIDLVPMNKIIAFGGDYGAAVENIYGSLKISRETVTKVLAGRIGEGLLTENEAIKIAKKWYHDNPKQLYQLKI